MVDEDPSRLNVCLEVRSFFSLMNMVIDKILRGGLSLHQFRPLLGPRTALIQNMGHPELAQAIADDLAHLEGRLQRLQELQAAGASSYVATQMDARLEAWRGARAFTGLEVQMQRDRADQLRAVIAETYSSLSHIQTGIVASAEKIILLRRELHAEEDNMSNLELTKANKEEALAVASRELDLSKQKIAEIEEAATKTLNTDEESFRAELQGELHQAYSDEVSRLEQQILCHRLDV